MQASIKEVEAVLMADELKARRKVLRKLGHLSDEGVISNKGRVACELSTADELLTTELVFSGLLNEARRARSTSGAGGVRPRCCCCELQGCRPEASLLLPLGARPRYC